MQEFNYEPGTKIHELFTQLKYKFKKTFKKHTRCHLFECMPFVSGVMDEYIDEYLKLYPEKINDRRPDGKTPLILAVFTSNFKRIKILLKYNPDLNMQDNEGNTALIVAIYNIYNIYYIYNISPIQLSTIAILLEHDANPNIKNYTGKTALMYAVRHPEIIKLLLENGADPNITDNLCKTALSYTTSEESIRVLLNYGLENVNVKMFNNKKIYDHLTYAPPEDIIQLLVKHKFNFYEKQRSGGNYLYRIFNDAGLFNYNEIINIISPQRKPSIEALIKVKPQRFWGIKLCDFKIKSTKISTFISIIRYM